MKKTTLLIAYCCASLLASFALAADRPPAITVTGTGEVFEKPDMARVSIGVVTQSESASESLKQNTDAVEEVFATLKAYKIAEEDMQTSNFSIGPEYDYNRSGAPPRLVGYRVSNEVRVAVRRIGDLGKLLDAVVTAGSNQINEVSFGIDEAGKLEDAARRMAIGDARRKAALYAQEAGVRLGSVLGIEEIAGFQPIQQFAAGMVAEARAVPIAPGQLSVRQVVSVTFAIESD